MVCSCTLLVLIFFKTTRRGELTYLMFILIHSPLPGEKILALTLPYPMTSMRLLFFFNVLYSSSPPPNYTDYGSHCSLDYLRHPLPSLLQEIEDLKEECNYYDENSWPSYRGQYRQKLMVRPASYSFGSCYL